MQIRNYGTELRLYLQAVNVSCFSVIIVSAVLLCVQVDVVCGQSRGDVTAPLRDRVQDQAESTCTDRELADLKLRLQLYFDTPQAKRSAELLPPKYDQFLTARNKEIRTLVWEAYRASKQHASLRASFKSRNATFEKHVMPYTLKHVGEKPEGGWPVFITMHGGGGAPKQVNDSQWRIMQRYYMPGAQGKDLIYIALRAPNDKWNGFYDDYVYPLVGQVIRQLLVCEDVNPNRIHLMGYSHGGYGAFTIGPKMPDRFASIHSSAAAPTDGQTSAKTLRNTVFTFMIGERDTAYGRLSRCVAFDKKIAKLRGQRDDMYPVTMELKKGFGHGGLPDRGKIASMYKHVRKPVPAAVHWAMTDSVITQLNWLQVDEPGRKQEVFAACKENVVSLMITGRSDTTVLLDGRLVDMTKPVAFHVNGVAKRSRSVAAKLITLCETLWQTGDPELMFEAKVKLNVE
jgi:predicted esterase